MSEIKRCQHCRRITGDGPRSPAVGFTQQGHWICKGCASWYDIPYAPTWALDVSRIKEEDGDLPKVHD